MCDNGSARPTISVVCAWYQRPDYIRYTLDSIRSQEVEDVEVIVVNDGSPDSAVDDILAEYAGANFIVVRQDNKGFVSAINKAIEISRGEFVAIHGAGDASHPKRLRRQLELIRSNDNVAVVGCGYETIVNSVAGRSSGIQTLPYKNVFGLQDILQGRTGFTHGSLMFRRSALAEVGGYRCFFKYGQDRDLLIRLMERGWIGMNVPEVLYTRHAFETDGVSGNKRKLLIQQALVTFALQCHRDRQRTGADYVDLYGADAMLFRLPDKRYAGFVAKLGLISVLVDDIEMAREFLLFSLREKLTPWGVALYIVSNIVWPFRPARRALHAIVRTHPRYHSWVSKR